MAAVTALVALTTARTLLNDDAGGLFTDVLLLPKLIQAFRMMVAWLRINAADVMIGDVASNLAINATSLTISDINEPIKMWEKAQGAGNDTYLPMTEYDPLPNKLGATTLRYWQWDGSKMNFIPCSASRTVRTTYWKVLTEPSAAGSSLQLINAEYYIAPMTASIMALSLGEAEQAGIFQANANDCFKMIIDANRGRQAPPNSTRP